MCTFIAGIIFTSDLECTISFGLNSSILKIFLFNIQHQFPNNKLVSSMLLNVPKWSLTQLQSSIDFIL